MLERKLSCFVQVMRLTRALGVVLFLAAYTLARADEPAGEQQSGAEGVAPRPPVRVTIGKETTYITGPLRPDGYVDYLAALNEIASQDVTSENNAVVLIWQILGPDEMPESLRPRFFAMLGMPEPPVEGPYFVPLEQFARRLPGKPTSPDTADWKSALEAQQEQAKRRAWSKPEFPELAEWVAANEQAIDRLVVATRRPKFYAPFATKGSERMVLAATQYTMQATRELARALILRATLRMHEREFAAAWEDIEAVHRLARLVAQGKTIEQGLIAAAIDYLAYAGDWVLAGAEGLSAADARRFGEVRAKLPRFPDLVDQIDIGERFAFLDAVSSVARSGDLSMENLSAGLSAQSQKSTVWRRLSRWAATAIIDWNVPLQFGNAWYDRVVAALRLPTPAERTQAIAKLADADRSRFDRAKDWSYPVQEQTVGGVRGAFGNRVFDIFLAVMAIDANIVIGVETRQSVDRDLAVLAYALAAFRADQRSYPATLDQLVPKYAQQIPTDRFADAPLHYERTGDGYTLYSVGYNRQDDGGHDGNSDPPEDDIVVRVQRKAAD